MIYETTITILPEEENNKTLIENKILKQLSIKNKSSVNAFVLKKKSIDARKGKIKFHLKYSVYVGENPEQEKFIPKWKTVNTNKKVVIVGSGPAGLFAALQLLEFGIKPIVIERGSRTSKRKVDIAKISTTGIVDENSNYCFGEGGAGTFSDGKLFTRSNKRGDISKILSIFHYHGADEKILSDAHPHIGSDKLPKIINNMIDTIIKFGGEVYFDKICTDLILEKDEKNNFITKGIICIDSNEKTIIQKIYSDAVILATGHSATDIYKMIYDCCCNNNLEVDKVLQEKTFAVGVRVEHPRQVIDKIQYHGKERTENLGAAEYRLTTQVDERGVYSFCMCPGGLVVPSSSGKEEIVVNGMSPSSRNSKWSNSAIVVEVRPEDAKEILQKNKIDDYENLLSALNFRTYLEKLTYQNGNGIKAPAQKLIDFIEERKTNTFPETSYTPGLISSRLDLWLPDFIKSRLQKAFKKFNENMKGFICDEAILIASETRTSTPIRILRDKETMESPVIKNLYPAGEGSGYSGGIVSSAMDGENVAKKISENFIINNLTLYINNDTLY